MQTVQIARLAQTHGRPRRWQHLAGDCQQLTRTAMRGGDALYIAVVREQVLRTLKYALAKRQKHALAKKEKRDQTYLGMRMYTAVVVMIVCDSNSVCNLILLIGN
jgi:hypothetical protein